MIDPAHYPAVFSALNRFRAFHAELTDSVAAARDGSLLSAGVPADAQGDGGLAVARILAQRLQGAITRHAGESGPRMPDGGQPVDMGYVLAALADEIFLSELDWPGRSHWDILLLEQRLYGTRNAADRLFAVAEQLIATRPAGREDLVVALMQVFALGFRGCYRDVNDRGTIRRLRRQLYQLALNRPAPSSVEWQEVLPPSAPLNGEIAVRGPGVRSWVYATAGAAVLFLVITHVVWFATIGDTLAAADRIVAADRGGDR